MMDDQCYFCDKKLGRSHKVLHGEKEEVKIAVNLCNLCHDKLKWFLKFHDSTETPT